MTELGELGALGERVCQSIRASVDVLHADGQQGAAGPYDHRRRRDAMVLSYVLRLSAEPHFTTGHVGQLVSVVRDRLAELDTDLDAEQDAWLARMTADYRERPQP